MASLLLLCLPIVFTAYASQLEEKSKHFFIYSIGILCGTVVSFCFALFFPTSFSYTDTQGAYSFYFFGNTFFPLFIALICALFFSGFNVLTLPACLFGTATVKIYAFIFLNSSHIRMLPIVLHILVYTSAIFIFDAALRFFVNMMLHPILSSLFSFGILVCALALGSFAIGLQYFNENTGVYISIFVGLILIAAILHVAAHRN